MTTTWMLHTPRRAGGPWCLHEPRANGGYVHFVPTLDEALRRARAGGAEAVELATHRPEVWQ